MSFLHFVENLSMLIASGNLQNLSATLTVTLCRAYRRWNIKLSEVL